MDNKDKIIIRNSFSWGVPWLFGFMFTVGYWISLNPGKALIVGHWTEQVSYGILLYILWPVILGHMLGVN